MSDPTLFEIWTWSLVLAGVIVVAAAALLIVVWVAARRIRDRAATALEVVEQIKANTAPVWALDDTNEVAAGLLDEAGSILAHAGAVATALHDNEPPRREVQP